MATKLAQFTDDPRWIANHSSVDARALAEINLLTYQVLSTPGENLDFVERDLYDYVYAVILFYNMIKTEPLSVLQKLTR